MGAASVAAAAAAATMTTRGVVDVTYTRVTVADGADD